MTKGHNNPPDAIDQVIATHADIIEEAQNWTDGEVVENEGQMTAVELLTKQMKAAKKDAVAGQKSESAPHFDAHKAAIARWKPTVEDFQSIIDCLIAANAPFKANLLEEQRAKERAEWDKVNATRLEAERLAREANASDLEAQREAQAAAQAVIDAEKEAKASKVSVKGMRTVHHYDIEDGRLCINWILQNDRDALTAFMEHYVSTHHRNADIDGVKSWQTKEAF